MHDYRSFIQTEMDARGWDRPRLERETGLSRQQVHKLLTDNRDTIGRMPDESTLRALGSKFGYEKVRTAAARSLARYTDDGAPITTDLSTLPLDALFEEIRRRVDSGRPVIEEAELHPPLNPGWLPVDPPAVSGDEESDEGGELSSG